MQLLKGTLEYHCCREVSDTTAKMLFDMSIETINCITQIGHIEHVIKQKCFKEKKRKLYKIEKFEQITTEQNEKIDELITNEENFLQEVLEQDESVKNERTTGHGPSFQTT